MAKMSTIEFRMERADTPCSDDCRQVRVYVDGLDYTYDSEGSFGPHPTNLFKQEALLKGGTLIFAICCCGCEGCGDSIVDVSREAGRVIWRQAKRGEREFEAAQYVAAVEKARADRSWEREIDTLQRLASEFNYSAFENEGWKFRSLYPNHEKQELTIYFDKSAYNLRQCNLPCTIQDNEETLVTLKNWLQTASPRDFEPVIDYSDPKVIEEMEKKAKKLWEGLQEE